MGFKINATSHTNLVSMALRLDENNLCKESPMLLSRNLLTLSVFASLISSGCVQGPSGTSGGGQGMRSADMTSVDMTSVDMGETSDMSGAEEMAPSLDMSNAEDMDSPDEGMSQGCVSGGDGVQNAPIIICDQNDLSAIRDDAPSLYYRLGADIELDDTWQSIPTFRGNLDGADHTISNITMDEANVIETSCDGDMQAPARGGLIDLLVSGSIRNIRFRDITFGTQADPLPHLVQSGNSTCDFYYGGVIGRTKTSGGDGGSANRFQNIYIMGLDVHVEEKFGGFASDLRDSDLIDVHLIGGAGTNTIDTTRGGIGGIARLIRDASFSRVSAQVSITQPPGSDEFFGAGLIASRAVGVTMLDVAARGEIRPSNPDTVGSLTEDYYSYETVEAFFAPLRDATAFPPEE